MDGRWTSLFRAAFPVIDCDDDCVHLCRELMDDNVAIMWSDGYSVSDPSWGCRCCQLGVLDWFPEYFDTQKNENWDLYYFDRSSINAQLGAEADSQKDIPSSTWWIGYFSGFITMAILVMFCVTVRMCLRKQSKTKYLTEVYVDKSMSY